MKTLKQFINEGLFNLRDYRRIVKSHIVTPKTREELEQIIKDTIEKEGNECDLNFIDTSKITDMSFVFSKNSEFNGDISDWDVSNVKDMSGMFASSKFNGDISDWDVSNVKNMSCMFERSDFNNDISDWDVSNVKDMRVMFYESKFNGDISEWDVSNVIDMTHMFFHSTFNGDISKWTVSGGSIKAAAMFNRSPLKKIYGSTPYVDKNGHFVKV